MSASGDTPHLRVPVGADARRWRTFAGERTLVVAARTVTSTVRVLETLPAVLRGDDRVRVVFAYDPTSAFNDGVLELLRTAGCRVMPWSQLATAAPDLIVSASENIDVPEDTCPVLVLPHGIGFQKYVPDSRRQATRLSGVVPDALLESGRAWLALSHPEQREQLLAGHPKADGRTLLVGDPCFDELSRSLPYADGYRRALGVAPGQRLVVVSSTWGTGSLIGEHPHLPSRLLAGLPADEYRVAAVLHPNVWSAHGAWQIRTIQAAALDAGLLLMPTLHDWRAALVAADAVIGDHGSVTLYAAALGKPVRLAAFGSEAVPGTAAERLARSAPAFDCDGDLERQVGEAVADPRTGDYAAIGRGAFAEPGHAVARLRTALYGLLRLAEPGTPPPAVRLPDVQGPPARVTSWQVRTELPEEAAEQPGGPVTVRRYPAAVRSPGDPESARVHWHQAGDEDEPDQLLLANASAVGRRTPASSAEDAAAWVVGTLRRLPGCLLATTPTPDGGCLTGLRDGRAVHATAPGGPPLDALLTGAVVYARLRAGLPVDRARAAFEAGPVSGTVTLRAAARP
jgi:hypothetical protein